jgi:16S rRNA processing protein RimM
MQRNNLIKLGKYVNTHGIKGEIRILSKFPHDEELQPGNKVLIKDQEFTINGFRKHKNFTLITFEGINNINDIEYLKGQFVYGESQSEEPYIPEYIGFEIVLNDEVVGEVTDYFLQGST